MIEVYHQNNPSFTDNVQPFTPRNYTYVATVFVGDNLDAAFRLTQHAERPWFEWTEVQVTTSYTQKRARSTSVGDILRTEDGKLFVVSPVGFKEIGAEVKVADLLRELQEIKNS